MSEEKKKMDLFQLIALVVIVGAVFAGLYYTNLMISARFDSLETAQAGNASTLETIIERLDRKVETLEQNAKRETGEAPEELAKAEEAPADEAAAAEGEDEEAAKKDLEAEEKDVLAKNKKEAAPE
jgi:hypothetical protein